MGMSLGGNGRPHANINMTPMIDVLLVLIIIFMVITPTTSHGLNAFRSRNPALPRRLLPTTSWSR
jgi:biopolymer transport protein ExbD